ncbi:hypothetical protein EN809_039850, partial [Mesorhizobium sp. M2E.F.Ca.ET.166.01.1.1]
LMQGFKAHRDHVWCKLSGMVTGADWRRWKSQDLQPYVDAVLSMVLLILVFMAPWPLTAVASVLAAISQFAGMLVERWLFFAEAKHTVTLYFGRE